MTDDTKEIALQVAQGDDDPTSTVVTVSLCESSASIQFNGVTVHIPWSEMALWHLWLAERVEKEA